MCKVKNNGYLSNIIKLFRGIRQGCAISAMIFILVVEILALKLKQNQDVRGISVRKLNGEIYEQLLSQYADDAALCLEDETKIQPAIETINEFSLVAGPKLNLHKTEGLWLGNLKHRQNNEICFNISFSTDPIRSLGIYIGHDKDKCFELNWTKKITLIQKLADSWTLRNLTLIGKIYVIKSELLSKIIFCASILSIPEGIIKQLNGIFFRFLWQSTDKIQRKILSNDYDMGGLKMIDIESQFHALKAAWIPRYLSDRENPSAWCIFPNLYFGYFGTADEILKMNFTNKNQFPRFENIPSFYQEIIIGFNMTKHVIHPSTTGELLDSLLWGNQAFTYSICSKRFVLADYNLCENHILRVRDLKFVESKLDQNYLLNRLRNKSSLFTVIKHIITALRPYMYLLNNHTPVLHNNDNWTQVPMMLIDNNSVNIINKKSKYFYKCIIDKKLNLHILIRSGVNSLIIMKSFFHKVTLLE